MTNESARCIPTILQTTYPHHFFLRPYSHNTIDPSAHFACFSVVHCLSYCKCVPAINLRWWNNQKRLGLDGCPTSERNETSGSQNKISSEKWRKTIEDRERYMVVDVVKQSLQMTVVQRGSHYKQSEQVLREFIKESQSSSVNKVSQKKWKSASETLEMKLRTRGCPGDRLATADAKDCVGYVCVCCACVLLLRAR